MIQFLILKIVNLFSVAAVTLTAPTPVVRPEDCGGGRDSPLAETQFLSVLGQIKITSGPLSTPLSGSSSAVSLQICQCPV